MTSTSVLPTKAPAAVGDVTKRQARRARRSSVQGGLGMVAALLALWYLGAGLLQLVNDPSANSKLPFPHLVLERFIVDIDRVGAATWTSLSMAIAGFIIGSLTGMILGVLLTQASWTEVAFMPYLLALQMIPTIALIPLAQSVLQNDVATRLFIAALIAVLPVTVAAIRGLRSASEESRELMASYDAGRFATLRLLFLPASVPMVFTGLRIAAPLSLLGAVLVDLMGGSNGLGHLILAAQTYGPSHAVLVWVSVVVLVVLGSALTQLIVLLERLCAPWQAAKAAVRGGEDS